MIDAGEERNRRVLVCAVGDVRCALPLDAVVETMRPLPTERMEQAPSFVSGVAIVRGEPMVVLDAALLLGVQAPVATRLVVLRVGERTAALTVSSVVGVREVALDALHAMPPMLQDATPDAVATVGRLDAELLVMLDGGHLVLAAQWDERTGAMV